MLVYMRNCLFYTIYRLNRNHCFAVFGIKIIFYCKAYVFFSVKDDGIGMSEKTLAKIFERYYQGDSSHKTEGNGLGLSIAQSMTELQGGSFKIDIDGDLFKVSLSFPVLVEQA